MPLVESLNPLKKLELASDAVVAVSGRDGEHVRVQIWDRSVLTRVGSGLDTGERHGETDEIFGCTLGVLGAGDVEGADDLASDALADDEDAARDDVSVGVAPGVDLELDAGVELVKALAGADEDGAAVAGHCRGRRHLRNGGHTLTILPRFWSQEELALGFGEFGSIPEGFEFVGG